MITITKKRANEIIELSSRGVTDAGALEYLRSRKVTDAQIDKFNIGYLPTKYHIDDYHYIDRCLVFPLYSLAGTLTGLEIRKIDTKSYIKYRILDTDNESIWFGLHQNISVAWKTSTVFLVEGIFDLLAVDQAIDYAGSCLTANLSKQQYLDVIRSFKNVVLCFDNDEVGVGSSKKIEKRLKLDGVNVINFQVAGVKDPGEFVEKFGVGRLKSFINEKVFIL